MSQPFDPAAATRMLDEVFAPWVRELAPSVVACAGGTVVLRMPFAERLCRDSGVVCGQALMALADTAMAVAIASAAGGYRPMTTVDQTAHFLKPVAQSAVLATATVIRLGRTMAFGRVDLASESDGKPVAVVQTAYALLQ